MTYSIAQNLYNNVMLTILTKQSLVPNEESTQDLQRNIQSISQP